MSLRNNASVTPVIDADDGFNQAVEKIKIEYVKRREEIKKLEQDVRKAEKEKNDIVKQKDGRIQQLLQDITKVKSAGAELVKKKDQRIRQLEAQVTTNTWFHDKYKDDMEKELRAAKAEIESETRRRREEVQKWAEDFNKSEKEKYDTLKLKNTRIQQLAQEVTALKFNSFAHNGDRVLQLQKQVKAATEARDKCKEEMDKKLQTANAELETQTRKKREEIQKLEDNLKKAEKEKNDMLKQKNGRIEKLMKDADVAKSAAVEILKEKDDRIIELENQVKTESEALDKYKEEIDMKVDAAIAEIASQSSQLIKKEEKKECEEFQGNKKRVYYYEQIQYVLKDKTDEWLEVCQDAKCYVCGKFCGGPAAVQECADTHAGRLRVNKRKQHCTGSHRFQIFRELSDSPAVKKFLADAGQRPREGASLNATL